MLIGHVGAAIGYLIVVFLLCWFVILSRGRVLWKVVTIAFSIFYAVALYQYLPSLEGFPSSNDIPSGSILLSIKVKEPKGSDPGAFFLWCNPQPAIKEKAMSLFTPGGFLAYIGEGKPRAYFMPYDRELHKRLLEQKKKAEKVGGFLVVNQKKGKKKSKLRKSMDGTETPSNMEFQVINPVEVLTK